MPVRMGHEPPPGQYLSIAANNAVIQWDIGNGPERLTVPLTQPDPIVRLAAYLEREYVRDQIYEWASRCAF